jgi:hypothetical protein
MITSLTHTQQQVTLSFLVFISALLGASLRSKDLFESNM